MTLIVEDLETRALEQHESRAVAGGIGPTSGPGAGIGVGMLSGQVGGNSLGSSAASYGVLNTTISLALQVAPQVNVSTANIVDLDQITDISNILNSVVG